MTTTLCIELQELIESFKQGDQGPRNTASFIVLLRFCFLNKAQGPKDLESRQSLINGWETAVKYRLEIFGSIKKPELNQTNIDEAMKRFCTPAKPETKAVFANIFEVLVTDIEPFLI